MRLSVQDQKAIKEILLKHFGAQSRVMVFGSRINDDALGGDIDLYIEPEFHNPELIVDSKLEALVELKLILGDQKIDLVINRKQGTNLPIYQIARESGVLI